MNLGMASLTKPLSSISASTVGRVHHKRLKLWKSQSLLNASTLLHTSHKHLTICCTNMSPWESASVTYSPHSEGKLLKETTNIFDTLSSGETAEASVVNAEEITVPSNQSPLQLQYLKWPIWVLGPILLLATGIAPTLWLPLSSIFLGPNIASLLSLVGLDCIFNLGASLFLLMADSCASPKNSTQGCSSKPPSSYQFWNMVANVLGYIIPVTMLLGSQKGLLQPQLPFISSAVILGPYLLLLTVQMLTEMLTWHWQSPVWLVTPVVYEAYRLLQLMRGLKLGVELGAPSWMVHTIRGLVCGWVLVLGMQLMRVVWYTGFTARTYNQESTASVEGN